MKKGFTLIELIAIIALLGIITTLIIPTVTNSVKLSKKKAKLTTIDNIERAARVYGIENSLGYDSDKKILTFQQLMDAGYLEDREIIDPTTDETLDGCILYHWDESSNQYIYKYSEEC